MQELSPSLHEQVDAAARRLGAAASLTLQQQGAVVRAVSSDAGAAACDQVEARLGAGPCIAAMEQLRVVVVPRVREGCGWSAWRARAADAGFASAVAVPAPVAPGVCVALNLYSTREDAWDDAALAEAARHAQLLADELAGRLARPLARLHGTVDARVRIDQAIGVLMHCNACTEQDAEASLMRASTADRVDLAEAAGTVLRALVEDDAVIRPRELAVPGR
ncbi:ANTAR domain-containing protein [Cellulomonas sp. NS3]|uniref:ANTAR domain-containing protein n=1 Tax=Cellulomonas sp. NS3 TaxID=2973977 RepID=UPI002161A035|nr:ANTAR domain-containing protein [Cellulomonas sp. NS3]